MAGKSSLRLRNHYNRTLSDEEAENVPVCHFMKDGVLMRKYGPPEIRATDEWKVYRQIVAYNKYRSYISGPILLHYQAILLHYQLVVTLLVNLELHYRLMLHYWALLHYRA